MPAGRRKSRRDSPWETLPSSRTGQCVPAPAQQSLTPPAARSQRARLPRAANYFLDTLQPIKMPQISPQKLDKPRNKGARKPEMVFNSSSQQAGSTTLSSDREVKAACLHRCNVLHDLGSADQYVGRYRVRRKKRSGQRWGQGWRWDFSK